MMFQNILLENKQNETNIWRKNGQKAMELGVREDLHLKTAESLLERLHMRAPRRSPDHKQTPAATLQLRRYKFSGQRKTTERHSQPSQFLSIRLHVIERNYSANFYWQQADLGFSLKSDKLARRWFGIFAQIRLAWQTEWHLRSNPFQVNAS